MHILNIFKFSYYTDSYVDPEFKLFWPLVIILSLLLVATIFFNWRFNRLNKKLTGERRFWWAHWLNLGYTGSIVGLIHLFFRYQNMPYFNWRLWPSLLVLGILGWLGYLGYYRYKLLPKKRVEQEVKRNLAYYFRRRKK